MVADFFKRMLRASEPAELRQDDARAAITAVLVMAARADGVYDEAEREVVDKALMQRFALGMEDARALRAQGEEAESESIDIYQFTKAIRTAIPHEDRIAIVEALWSVVLADGERDPHEDSLMRQLVDRLGLSPMDSALARQKVQGHGSISGM
ncbi:MAG: TerB family tellurite resistance protein [Hyphomonadaceae bacterium]